ncbi:MAG TPA: cytochrome-c peroxidase [Gallionella sp.]|nr:cytochrome-c peroxidase [Gallionella sp.]
MNISKSEIAAWSKRHAVRLAAGGLAATLLASGAWWLQGARHGNANAAAQMNILPVKTDFSVVQPLPERVALDPAKVALGERLFNDARLSADNSIACASCHNLTAGGADNRVHSLGVNRAEGNINAPTVFNSGFNFVQFWDGRAATLEDQIEGPVNNPKEMASNWPQVIARLSGDAAYPAQFAGLYRDGITASNIKNAIATFERSLVTPNSRFDQYLRGNQSALSKQEKQGFELFQAYGCASCHQGINLGGNMFEKMGLTGDYFADRGNPTEADNGRFNLGRDERKLHEFRVPPLRNVARTAPYFHDGSAQTLPQAIAIMAKYQLGRTMPAGDVEAISAFLGSLTGEYKGAPL